MKECLKIGPAYLDENYDLHVIIDGLRFWAGEKYTFLEQGWAVYLGEDEVPAEWLRNRGETRSASDGWSALKSKDDTLITSHPVLVALSLRAWWHRNGRLIDTAPEVSVPSFEEAVQVVREREICNDFNMLHNGTVPGLERWKSGRRNIYSVKEVS